MRHGTKAIWPGADRYFGVWPVSAVNWWLRSPNSSNNNNAYYVNTSGALNNNNVYNANNYCPRPASACRYREQVTVW
ncbi:DUF6273 domain-containing protein [Flintibacter porci]|uniref:DUF6273 domain-containing protein n=1 Tax=Flintibacter porci TaxID=3342383 RepID=UPI003F89C530